MKNVESANEYNKQISSKESKIQKLCAEFAKLRDSECYPLLLRDTEIQSDLVDKVFEDLQFGNYTGKNLDVIIDSSGGNIDAAYNLALLFRRFGTSQLTFVVPRRAKSAATLLICAGNEILMTPVAEIGPLDPQITTMNPLENRIEQFSPLHIESTLELIRDEIKSGHSELANALLQRLQFPLTLGRYKKLLELGREYLEKLLLSRMLENDKEKAKVLSNRLTTGYADHSWCITIEESKELGLNASELEKDALEIVWKIHKLNKKVELLRLQKSQSKLKADLKNFPSDLLEDLP